MTVARAYRHDAADATYIFLQKCGEAIEVSGQTTAKFGHQIPSTSHSSADGVFASWLWDGARLVVNNDRYGFYPLFWFSPPGGGVCVSPSLATLIEQGAPADLDVEALAVFFRLSYFVGDDTPFSAIKTVPPNAVFEWTNGKLQCHGRYPSVSHATALSRDDAIDRYIELFGQSVARRTPDAGTCAMPISGGRDSRHILLELHRNGFEPTVCVSAMDNPPDAHDDPKVAAALCKELGFKHIVIDQKLSLLSAQLRKNSETHFCAAAHGWYVALADVLNGRFDCAYDGIAGDVLSQSKFLNPGLDAAFRSGETRAICDRLLSQTASNYAGLHTLLKGDLKAALDPEVAAKRLGTEVERHLDGPNPVASFIFWNRTRREIALAPYSLLSGIDRVYAPFLDHDLFDFLTTLPSSMLMDHTFHDDTIARAYPEFSHIPYVGNGSAPTDDSKVRTRFLAESARRFLLKRPSRLMKNVRPRAKMLTSVLTGGRVNPWLSPLVIYLDQLESLTDKRGKGSDLIVLS